MIVQPRAEPVRMTSHQLHNPPWCGAPLRSTKCTASCSAHAQILEDHAGHLALRLYLTSKIPSPGNMRSERALGHPTKSRAHTIDSPTTCAEKIRKVQGCR